MSQADNLAALGSNVNTSGVLQPAGGGTGTTTATGTGSVVLSSGATLTNATINGAVASGFTLKNRIINGDMVIDQRNAGASVTVNVALNTFAVDRTFGTGTASAGVFTMAQSSIAPAGFSRSLLITVTTADASLAASDLYMLGQNIEGFNTADLNFGTANAATITLSFWVRSSVTGTYGGSFLNEGVTRSYPYTYTISAANTWEKKTITISGDTTGTWTGSTNGVGLRVTFGLGAGSTFSGTAGSWQSADFRSASGVTNLMATNGATFYITGVQLEQGSAATSFEWLPYGTELMLCQRYYEKSYDTGTAIGTATGSGAVYSSGSNGGLTTSFLSDGRGFIVSKRAAPTLTIYDQAGNSGKCNREYFGVSSTANSAVVIALEGTNNFIVYSSGTANSMSISYHYVASAEL